MAPVSQKRWNNIDQQTAFIAYQTQLNQSSVQPHGLQNLKAAIEQNAGTLSSVGAKPHDQGAIQDGGNALSTMLGGFAQLAVAPPQGGLNVNAAPFVPSTSVLEVKRCTYCLNKGPASMFSKTQWKAKPVRARYRRTREPTATVDLEASFKAFDDDGEPFTWRRCFECAKTNKCLKGEAGFLKKTDLAPNLSFLDTDDEKRCSSVGEEGTASHHEALPIQRALQLHRALQPERAVQPERALQLERTVNERMTLQPPTVQPSVMRAVQAPQIPPTMPLVQPTLAMPPVHFLPHQPCMDPGWQAPLEPSQVSATATMMAPVAPGSSSYPNAHGTGVVCGAAGACEGVMPGRAHVPTTEAARKVESQLALRQARERQALMQSPNTAASHLMQIPPHWIQTPPHLNQTPPHLMQTPPHRVQTPLSVHPAVSTATHPMRMQPFSFGPSYQGRMSIAADSTVDLPSQSAAAWTGHCYYSRTVPDIARTAPVGATARERRRQRRQAANLRG